MSFKKMRILCFALLSSPVLFAQTSSTKKAADIVSKMTLDEKVHFLVGMGMKLPPGIKLPDGSESAGPVVGQSDNLIEGAAGTTYSISRLGIPAIVLADGPAGVRINPKRDKDPKTYYATAFPIGSMLASSWDTALVRKVGIAMGNEAKEYGVDLLLAPALNIQRNPLNGRNFEYYSEDPLVAGRIAAAFTKGVQSQNVGVSIKHFAANNQETNRNTINTIVSERALREIYLKGFEIAVKESNPWTVMSSYNKINGPYTSENPELLTTILRKEWGYKGIVMTDWFGGKDPVAQMKAGNDLLMPGTPLQTKKIIDAVNNKSLDEKLIDLNATRMLQIVMQSPSYQKYAYSNQPNLKQHGQIAKTAATEGMVLLQNNAAALPIAKQVKNIAVFGIGSYDLVTGGTGSGDVNKAYSISLEAGLKTKGYQISQSLKNTYTAYIAKAKAALPPKKMFFEPNIPIDEMNMNFELIAAQALQNDLAIVTIGRSSGEFVDRKLDNDFYLSKTEIDLISVVGTAFHNKGKKLIVVLNIGGAIETASWKNAADAILLAWQPGQEAGSAISDILSGTVNPSGKLSSSFPITYKDVPSANNFPGKVIVTNEKPVDMGILTSVPAEVVYEEGVYVGYRYYQSFQKAVSFPFGFGLSYTNFAYSNLKLSQKTFNQSITVSVTITNKGKIAGKEIVQLYLSAPHYKMDKPESELKAFAKTALLAPGKSQTIKFVLSAKDLASFDTNSSSWFAEAGDYTVKIGSDVTAIKQKASFTLPLNREVEKLHKVLVPEVAINELKNK